MPSTDFGKHLISARVAAGLTQRELARAVKLPQSVISAIETGKRWPSILKLGQLALVLQVSLQKLLTGADRPGTELPHIALQLQNLGIADLHVPGARVPGAFRENEDVLTLALRGNTPPPQIVEAIPAILAWTPMDPAALLWFADRYDTRVRFRLAWLADIALTIHRGTGFPGGCSTLPDLERLVDIEPPTKKDDLGFTDGASLMPVSARWKIHYPATLTTFEQRAKHLHEFRANKLARALEALRHF